MKNKKKVIGEKLIRCEDINNSFYEFILEDCPPILYTPKLKEKYADRLFDLDKTEGVSQTDIELMKRFNNANITPEELFLNWDLFKDKDLTCIFSYVNKYHFAYNGRRHKKFFEDFDVNLLKSVMENDKCRSIIYLFAIRNRHLYDFIERSKEFKTLNELMIKLYEDRDGLFLEDLSRQILKGIIPDFVEGYDFVLENEAFDIPNEILKNILEEKSYGDFSSEYIKKILDSQFNVAVILSNQKLLEIIEKFGGLEKFLEFDEKYGNIFSTNNGHNLLFMTELESIDEHDDFITDESIFFEKCAEEMIFQKGMIYNETMFPQKFIDSNSEFFLSKNVPEEIRDKFYKKKLDLDIEDVETFQYFDNTYVYLGLSPKFQWLADICFNDKNSNKNIREINERCMKIVSLFSKINQPDVKRGFITIIKSNPDIDIDIISGNVGEYVNIYNRLLNSNSIQIYSLFDKIYEQLLELPQEADLHKIVNEIEKIFLDKYTIPSKKIFKVFEIMHPDIKEMISSVSSPILQTSNDKEQKAIIYSDLVDIMIRSNSRELRNSYINILNRSNLPLSEVNKNLNLMDEIVAETNSKNRSFANANQRMKLEDGDIIKGFDIEYLESLLKNGFRSKEFLGSRIDSDCTPLDTDVSIIAGNYSTDEEAMRSTPTGVGTYGNIYVVMKQDDRFIRSDLSQEKTNGYNKKTKQYKMELFATGGNRYGIRTGFPSSAIDYFKVDTSKIDIGKVGLKIALNGFYIPVYDMEGKLLFAPKDYDDIREKMSGLSYYGETEYIFSDNLINKEIESIVLNMTETRAITMAKQEELYDIYRKEFSETYGLELETEIGGDLKTGVVEFISTGSTGRGTNLPDDGDFDFIARIDRELIGKFNDERKKEIELKDGSIAEVDVTYVVKTDEVMYSTDEAIRDRLRTIEKQDPEKYKYVIANIIYAKQILKSEEIYKRVGQHGLGGVGVENWILQNGGSFYDACKSFLESAKGKSFDEFKKSYHIYDFGENHLAPEEGHDLHDDFVCNLSEESYKKMIQVLEKYVQQYKDTTLGQLQSEQRSALGNCLSDGKLRSGQAEKAIEAVNIAIRSKTSEISIQDEIDEDEQAE